MYHSVRRICHASPASGGIASCSWVAAGAAVITPQHRYITYAAGFPPSPWEAVSKSHYSPYRSMRTGRCPGLQGLYVDRSASLSIWSPFHKLVSWRRTLSRCCMVFVPAIPYIQFSKYPRGTKSAPFTKRDKRGRFTPCLRKIPGKIARQYSCRKLWIWICAAGLSPPGPRSPLRSCPPGNRGRDGGTAFLSDGS